MTEEKKETIHPKEEAPNHKEHHVEHKEHKTDHTEHKEHHHPEHKKNTSQQIKERKEKLIKLFKTSPNFIYYIGLAVAILIGVIIRTRNLQYLKDVTTGKFIPVALDPFLFLRYAKTLLETGAMPVLDKFRFVPFGMDPSSDSTLLSYTVVYLFKFLKIFIPSITIEFVHIIYPVIFFALALIIFFFLIKRIFNIRVALLATAYLAFIPPFLYRTTTGFADKEAIGIFFLFLTFYLYVACFQSKTIKKAIIFAALTGVSTTLLALSWGGVIFVFLVLSLFVFIEILLNKFERRDLYAYGVWLIVSVFLITTLSNKYSLNSHLFSFWTFMLFLGIVNEFIVKKYIKRLKGKLPYGVTSLIVSFIIIIIFTIITGTTYFLTAQYTTILRRLHGSGSTRWVLTVAESHQPYFVDLMSNFGGTIKSLFLTFNIGKFFMFLFFIGLILLFYNFTKPLTQKIWRYILTVAFTLFILLFTLSRYSGSSLLNGDSPISKTVYLGSLFGFVIIIAFIYIYSFYRNKSLFKEILLLDKKYTFILAWAVMMIIAARTAIRLLFVLAPVIVIAISYLLMESFDYSFKFKTKYYKYIAWIIIAFIIYITIIPFAQMSYHGAKNTGPSYNQQWQYAMQWVRENTPEYAVFAHWWDYGYWVQTGGERATILDGGNAIIYWNHLMGRHVLTGQSSIEAQEFLKPHNATHLLIIFDEIGKYPAYSSIGADENYDRYSQLGTFMLNPSQIQETREGSLFIYNGGMPLDEDHIIDGRLLPGWNAGIGGFAIPVSNMQNTNGVFTANFSTPSAVVVYQGQQFSVPVECLYFENREYNFDISNGLKGCIRIIPSINGDGSANAMGAAIYMSEKVRNTLFAQMFLLNKEWPGFKLAYDDSGNMPLAIYNGRLIGPLKIWEIEYSDEIEYKPEYLEKNFPNINLTLPR